MELLYNPDSMPEAEIKATFVARQWLVDEFISLINRQPNGAGVQHLLIIAPRGMGKTTVLLMVKFAINDSRLARQWQAVKFPEESYGVYDLADFWLEILTLIAADTNDEQLRQQVESLRLEFPNNDDLQEAALALIKDWRRKHKKRLALLVDNLDMILEQINDERDNARLREVLMNDGTMMLIGCAVSFFDEARSYDKPLYNFFKTYDLAHLKFEQMQELLRRRARLDRVENFEERLKANATRLRVLEYFTGGNPRLVLMLYRVVTQSDISEVQHALEKLLDEVTPYFKAKVESLPAQLRKILDHIARVSSKTNEGLTPTEIAQAVRLTANQVSAQLKRLSEMGYVRAANLRGRSSYYTLSEPLYAIWHQMRFGRDARERMQWLVNFLKAFYDAEEMGTESARLETRFRELLSTGRMPEARDVLQHRRYLAEAMDDSIARANTLDGVVRGYLDLKDMDTLRRDVLPSLDYKILPDETRKALDEAGCKTEQDIKQAKRPASTSPEKRREAKLLAAMKQSVAAFDAGRMEEAISHFDQAVKIEPELYAAWGLRGVALDHLGKHEEAIASYDRALGIYSDFYEGWNNRGIALGKLGKHQEAIVSFDHALELKPDFIDAWYNRGVSLNSVGRHGEALTSYDHALEIDPSNPVAWFNRGIALGDIRRYEEAVASYDHALEIKPDDHESWSNRGSTLNAMGLHEQAIASYDQALEIKADVYEVWYNRGIALRELGKYEEAISSYERALKINHSDYQSWNNLGIAFGELNKYEEAIASFDRGLKVKSDDCVLWYNRGLAFSQLGKLGDAITNFDHAIEIDPNFQRAWYHRAITYLGKSLELVQQDKNNLARQNWEEAEKSARHFEPQQWLRIASGFLVALAQSNNLVFAWHLIKESDVNETLFPLARAIDYLLTGDEALIEKLSPEVRGIVEEIVAKLRNTTNQSEQAKTKPRVSRKSAASKKSKTSKSKSTSRNRIRKRLR
jgi:tetratricopeptide (TPR) repeat protein